MATEPEALAVTDHPDLAGDADVQREARDMFAEWSANYEEINNGTFDPRETDRRIDWTGLLLEHIYGALAEAHPDRIRAELAQARDVIDAWATALDRRTA